MRRFLLLPAILFLSACSLGSEADGLLGDLGITDEDEYRTKRAQMILALESAIGEARATEASACAVVNVGTKACGGPVEYRVYSATDGDTDQILELAEEITELDDEANVAFGLASTCDVPVPPTPVLSGGRCVAG